MAEPVFIGGELTAAGFRLAGVRVVVPGPGQVAAALARARGEASLVLLGTRAAATLSAAELAAVRGGLSPPLVVVPEMDGPDRFPLSAAQIRAALGAEG